MYRICAPHPYEIIGSCDEVEKTIKEVRNKKATGDDDVPANVLRVLGECGLKQMTTDEQHI